MLFIAMKARLSASVKRVENWARRYPGLAGIAATMVAAMLGGAVTYAFDLITEQSANPAPIASDAGQSDRVAAAAPPEPAVDPAPLVEPEPMVYPPRPVKRTRTFEVGDTNNHCSGSRDVVWPVEAAEGWEIVPGSVKVSVVAVSSKSVYGGVTEETADGFTIRGRLVNNGDCIRAFGKTIARDGRGTLRVHAAYEEISYLPSNGAGDAEVSGD